jgi:DNA polymerase-3 subunit epsilon
MVLIHGTVSQEITEITGITNEDLKTSALPPEESYKKLLDMAKGCDYVVAHNGRDFDKPFVNRGLKEFGLSLDLPWIDTIYDVPYPEKITSRKLVHLCAEHGFLNPFSHRAVFDVLSMLNVMSRYDFSAIEDMYKSPQMKLIAKVSFEEKDKAKRAGFRWDPSEKVWYKSMKECQLKSVSFDFPTDVMS